MFQEVLLISCSGWTREIIQECNFDEKIRQNVAMNMIYMINEDIIWHNYPTQQIVFIMWEIYSDGGTSKYWLIRGSVSPCHCTAPPGELARDCKAESKLSGWLAVFLCLPPVFSRHWSPAQTVGNFQQKYPAKDWNVRQVWGHQDRGTDRATDQTKAQLVDKCN